MTIKHVAISFLLAFAMLGLSCICAKIKEPVCGPFTTTEWKQCYDECQSSMPINLIAEGFSEKEIIEFDIPVKCVSFCRKNLYQKRIDAGCKSVTIPE